MISARLFCIASSSGTSSLRATVPHIPIASTVSRRWVRRRATINQDEGEVKRQRSGEPVEWIKDATTYSGVHTVITDPTTKLPYREKELTDMMQRTARDAVREKNKHFYGKKAAVSKLCFDHIPIENQVVLLFPGQGAQFVGMGKKLSSSPRAMAMFERASAVLGYNLHKLCMEGPKSKLDQTLYCQPAVVVASLAAYEHLQEKEEGIAEKCTDAAGFSVGEFAALVAGGVLTFEDAVRIVAERAAAMHECSQLIRSGMATIRVNAASRLDDAIKAAKEVASEKGEMAVCEVANFLYCGVKVIGASETCMRFLEEHANTYRFQVVKRLAVSGAFHTVQMEGAVERLRAVIKSAELRPSVMNVYSNYTGFFHSAKKGDIRSALAKQVTSPVKWEQIQQLLYRKHKNHVFPRFIECGPGRQLGSMLFATSKKAYEAYKNVDV